MSVTNALANHSKITQKYYLSFIGLGPRNTFFKVSKQSEDLMGNPFFLNEFCWKRNPNSSVGIWGIRSPPWPTFLPLLNDPKAV